uniref:Uncharacterized protein n=1 Tax=Lepeophtheirus salmonis TaxID=72036 RepID=A0A0K2TUI8_LEPSM
MMGSRWRWNETTRSSHGVPVLLVIGFEGHCRSSPRHATKRCSQGRWHQSSGAEKCIKKRVLQRRRGVPLIVKSHCHCLWCQKWPLQSQNYLSTNFFDSFLGSLL